MLILIKANSYGHGAVDFARLMEKAGSDYLAVAQPVEGIELREGNITSPILVLTADPESFKEIVEYGLEPGIPTLFALKKFAATLKKMHVDVYPVHIKLDTGMHRLGFMEKELPELLRFLSNHPEIRVQSIYSHLAASDSKKYDSFTKSQVALFDKMVQQVEQVLGYHPIVHILNSAGIERFPQFQKDMVRLGIGIYGVSAINQKNVMPVACLKCRIIQVKELTPKDGTVGYSRAGKITRPSKIATIPLGYTDGINRHLGNGATKFCIKGKLAPTIGNVCMDMCMLDVTDIKNVKVGDEVTVFGNKPTAIDLANALKTIPYEVYTSVAKRVKRGVVK